MKTIITGVLCLIVGLILGRLTPHGSADERHVALDQKRDPGIRAENPNNNDSLRSTRTPARAKTDHTPAVGSGFPDSSGYGKLVTVPVNLIENLATKAGVPSIDQDLFSRDGSDEATLGITDREKAQIQQAWRQMNTQVKKLETKAASFNDLPDGSVQITIPDLSESVNALGGNFNATTKDVLGENRAEVFLAIKQVKRTILAQQGKLTCTVKMEAVGDGHWRYTIRRGRDGSLASQWITRTIPASIRHLTDKAGILPKLQAPVEEPEE